MSRPAGGGGAVSYEVTVTLSDPTAADRFVAWMLEHHIPTVLATGCFRSAELGRTEPSVFRTCYRAADRSDLDRYLVDHTAALRADFDREFGSVARATRQVWETVGSRAVGGRQ